MGHGASTFARRICAAQCAARMMNGKTGTVVVYAEPDGNVLVEVCVTADIPLASRGLLVIDSRGELYSESNISERLAVRDLIAA